MVCLVDIDGVLSDFFGGLCAFLGKDPKEVLSKHEKPAPYYLHDLFDLSAEELEAVMESLDAEFWSGLEKMPWADELLTELRKRFGFNVYLCTSVGYLDPGSPFLVNAVTGKEQWIIKHLPGCFRTDTVFCYRKCALASPNHLLIDDSYDQCYQFAAKGGTAVLFPAPWNSLHEHTKDPVKRVLEDVDRFLSGKEGRRGNDEGRIRC